MKIIASADKNWGIGYKNKLLVRIPNDMKNFRRETMGKVVVMGRKTLESFPGGRPLEKRTNIVLSRNPSFKVKDAIVVHSFEELLKMLEGYDNKDVYIIGGEQIYRTMLPYCDTALITKVEHAYEADAFLTNLDQHPEWVRTEESEEQTYFDLEYFFIRYDKKS